MAMDWKWHVMTAAPERDCTCLSLYVLSRSSPAFCGCSVKGRPAISFTGHACEGPGAAICRGITSFTEVGDVHPVDDVAPSSHCQFPCCLDTMKHDSHSGLLQQACPPASCCCRGEELLYRCSFHARILVVFPRVEQHPAEERQQPRRSAFWPLFDMNKLQAIALYTHYTLVPCNLLLSPTFGGLQT